MPKHPAETDLWSVIWLLVVLLTLVVVVTVGGIWWMGAKVSENEKAIWKLERRVKRLER